MGEDRNFLNRNAVLHALELVVHRLVASQRVISELGFVAPETGQRQRDRGKAQYLADAILCYEKAEMKSFQQTDRALIEQIVQEYLEKQSMGHIPNLQKEEPSISSPPIDLIASALADFRG